jgi:ADP-heptose:LPS heptosyltransferase
MTDTHSHRVAVIFPGTLGDFICLLPAIHALAESAQVEIFARTEFADIVPQNIRVGPLERYEINRLFIAGAAREKRVRDFFSRYERIYSWMGSSQPVFSGELGAVAPGRVQLFAFRATDSAMHQADYYLSCLRVSRRPVAAVNIPLARDALIWCAEFSERYALSEKALLVIAPGSGAREKNWPAASFATVGRWWRARTGGEAIVLLGPVEEQRGGFDPLGEDFIAARDLSLAQLAALLSRCELFIGNDSGVTHLAAALGAPTAAIFGPSDPRLWAPRGERVSLLSLGVVCSPCDMNAMKLCPHRQCLNDFSPLKIIGELEKINEVATLTRGGAQITVQAL